jgi:hypothetical protein
MKRRTIRKVQQVLRLYHVTPVSNVKSILKHGLRVPKVRKGEKYGDREIDVFLGDRRKVRSFAMREAHPRKWAVFRATVPRKSVTHSDTWRGKEYTSRGVKPSQLTRLDTQRFLYGSRKPRRRRR